MTNKEKRIQGPSIDELREIVTKSVTWAYVAPRDMDPEELIDTLCIHKEFLEAVLAMVVDEQPFLAEAPDHLKMMHVLARELFSRISPEVTP